MDLIYADEKRKDIGVLKSYSLDMAYGSDENDFTCSVARQDHCCKDGYFIYVENEDYGGVVDSIKVNKSSDSIEYKGRTWHGILESKVICPEPGDDYLVLAGEANEVLQAVIENIGLTSLFAASTEDSEIEVPSYQFDRYCYAYSGITKMLKEVGAKLRIRWQESKIVLSAEPIYDYSQDEEFDTSQVDFALEKNYRPVNHIICLGQGDLKDRAVIHIFTDEYGGVQQYLKDPTEEPIQDSDYILDTSKQVMFGQDDVVEVYDVSNAEITANYVQLTAKPSDWDVNCQSYYTYEPSLRTVDGEQIDAGGSYKSVELVDMRYELQKGKPSDWDTNYGNYYTYDGQDYSNVSATTVYQLLTSQPGDWASNFAAYYYKDGSAYKKVAAVSSTTYVKQTKQPADWAKGYSKYFVKNGNTYIAVTGATSDSYKRQTRKPSDWSTKYTAYFRRATSRELKKNKKKKWYSVTGVTAPKWKAKKYYTKVSEKKAPAWNRLVVYTRSVKTAAPTWQANKYYLRKDESAPVWEAGKYYSETEKKIPPEYVSNKYFKQYHDRMAVMVKAAIEKLEKYHASDSLDIDLEETEQTYDVGDIVGTNEQTTGMEAIQEVKKKIIKIQNDDIVISYEVG